MTLEAPTKRTLRRGSRPPRSRSSYFLWDGLRLLETRNADYTLKARFTHGQANVEGIGTCVEVYRASDGKRFYPLSDHRGSVHVLLDESKTVVASRTYNAYGEVISETGTWPSEVPFGYQSNWLALPGLTLPDGTQLYLSQTRIMNPKIGRFLQRDPMQRPGENLYVYARNQPVDLVDPAGMQANVADPEGMCPEEVKEKLKTMDPIELFKLLRRLLDRLVRDKGGTAGEGYQKRLGLLKAVEGALNDKTYARTNLAERFSKSQVLGRGGRSEVWELLGGVRAATGHEVDSDLMQELRRDTYAMTEIWASPTAIAELNRTEAEAARLEHERTIVEAALGREGFESYKELSPEEQQEIIRHLTSSLQVMPTPGLVLEEDVPRYRELLSRRNIEWIKEVLDVQGFRETFGPLVEGPLSVVKELTTETARVAETYSALGEVGVSSALNLFWENVNRAGEVAGLTESPAGEIDMVEPLMGYPGWPSVAARVVRIARWGLAVAAAVPQRVTESSRTMKAGAAQRLREAAPWMFR